MMLLRWLSSATTKVAGAKRNGCRCESMCTNGLEKQENESKCRRSQANDWTWKQLWFGAFSFAITIGRAFQIVSRPPSHDRQCVEHACSSHMCNSRWTSPKPTKGIRSTSDSIDVPLLLCMCQCRSFVFDSFVDDDRRPEAQLKEDGQTRSALNAWRFVSKVKVKRKMTFHLCGRFLSTITTIINTTTTTSINTRSSANAFLFFLTTNLIDLLYVCCFAKKPV